MNIRDKLINFQDLLTYDKNLSNQLHNGEIINITTGEDKTAVNIAQNTPFQGSLGTRTIAGGYRSVASGKNSVAFGESAKSFSQNSFAIGQNAIAGMSGFGCSAYATKIPLFFTAPKSPMGFATAEGLVNQGDANNGFCLLSEQSCFEDHGWDEDLFSRYEILESGQLSLDFGCGYIPDADTGYLDFQLLRNNNIIVSESWSWEGNTEEWNGRQFFSLEVQKGDQFILYFHGLGAYQIYVDSVELEYKAPAVNIDAFIELITDENSSLGDCGPVYDENGAIIRFSPVNDGGSIHLNSNTQMLGYIYDSGEINFVILDDDDYWFSSGYDIVYNYPFLIKKDTYNLYFKEGGRLDYWEKNDTVQIQDQTTKILGLVGNALIATAKITIDNTKSTVIINTDYPGLGEIDYAPNSFAEGRYTFASGDMSHAMGDGTKASGNCSLAGGSQSIASGKLAMAFGDRVEASGDASVALGGLTKATGQGSFAGGVLSEATSQASFAFGMKNKATEYNATAFGRETQAISQNSFAEGSNTLAGSKAYYWNAIDFENKKIYLSETQSQNITTIESVLFDTIKSSDTTMINNEVCEVTNLTKAEYVYDPDPEFFNGIYVSGGITLLVKQPIQIKATMKSIVYEEVEECFDPGTGESMCYMVKNDQPTNCQIKVNDNSIYYQDIYSDSYTFDCSENSLVEISGCALLTLEVYTIENLINQDFETPNWSVGDEISLVNDRKYDKCAKIVAIQNNEVTLDNIPFDEILTPEEIAFDDYTILNLTHPEEGLVDFGRYSHAEGYNTKAINYETHAEGTYTIAFGRNSHAEGQATEAAYSAHSEGRETKAYGQTSHAEGYMTQTTGNCAHSEGRETLASGYASHAQNEKTTASGDYSHSGGNQTEASGVASFAHGKYVKATGEGAIAIGRGLSTDYTEATGQGAFVAGQASKAAGDFSIALGLKAEASGKSSAALGNTVKASNDSAVALGKYVEASGEGSVAVGRGTSSSKTSASAQGAVALGQSTIANGQFSLAGGKGAQTKADQAFAFGSNTRAESKSSVAIGTNVQTKTGESAIAIGYADSVGSHVASGKGAIALGYNCKASGEASIAMGKNCQATDNRAIAMGQNNISQGLRTVALGEGLITIDNVGPKGQTVVGRYNNKNGYALFVVGSGSGDTSRQNTFLVYDPASYGEAAINVGGAVLTADDIISLKADICFQEGTQILMADGTQKAIEEVQYGDMIMTYDMDSNELVPCKSFGCLPTGYAHSYNHYCFDNGSILKIFGGHRVYDADKQELVYFSKMSIGDHVMTPDCVPATYCYSPSKVPAAVSTRKYTIFCETGLYFANNILCGHPLCQPLDLHVRTHGAVQLSDEDKATLQAYADARDNDYQVELSNPEYVKEAMPFWREQQAAKRKIQECKEKLAARDYKTIKAIQGKLTEEELVENINACEELRSTVNFEETVVADSQAHIKTLQNKYNIHPRKLQVMETINVKDAIAKARAKYKVIEEV